MCENSFFSFFINPSEVPRVPPPSVPSIFRIYNRGPTQDPLYNAGPSAVGVEADHEPRLLCLFHVMFIGLQMTV